MVKSMSAFGSGRACPPRSSSPIVRPRSAYTASSTSNAFVCSLPSALPNSGCYGLIGLGVLTGRWSPPVGACYCWPHWAHTGQAMGAPPPLRPHGVGPSLADGHLRVTCAAASGSVQVGKLKVYHLVLRNRRLHYAPGTLPTPLGPLPLQSGGFMLTGVPLVMGEQLGPQIAKAEVSLAKIERMLYRLRPAYVLVLRILLAYVISALDYVYEAMPPCPTRLRRTQQAVDRVLTRAPRVPRNVPRALLWMPVAGGGFGFPHLYSRMRLRHVQGFLSAMDSRIVLVRENVCALLHPDNWKGQDGSDLLHAMAETQLEVHVLLAAAAQLAAVDVWVYRPYESGGGILLAADGAMEVTPEGSTLGRRWRTTSGSSQPSPRGS